MTANINENKSWRVTRGGASGLTQVWKLWRHCCCRYGWYPLLVAPIVTASCLLDLYSSLGCEFLNVDVGFIPSNPAWNQSTAALGLFQYHSGMEGSDVLTNVFVEGCRRYSNEFESVFVDGDRTWEVTRIMAYISGAGGILATVTAWLMVVSPLPVCLFWPGVLLPSIMVAFLCEGSKFLFLDTSVCQSAIWFPSGTDSLPQAARSCALGSTSYFAIASGVSFFLCLLLVCLKSPNKRELDESYGENTAYIAGLGGSGLETSMEEDNVHDVDVNLRRMYPEQSFNEQPEAMFVPQDGTDYASSTDDGHSFDYPSKIENDSFFENMQKSVLYGPDGEQDLEMGSFVETRDTFDSFMAGSNGDKRDDNSNDLLSKPSSQDSDDSKKAAFSDQTIPNSKRVVSEIRRSTAETMQQQTESVFGDELIEKVVLDVTRSFQAEADPDEQS